MYENIKFFAEKIIQLTEAAEVWSLMLVWYSQSFCTYSSSNILWSISYSSSNHCRACSSQSSEIQYIFRHTNVSWVMECLTLGYEISLILFKKTMGLREIAVLYELTKRGA